MRQWISRLVGVSAALIGCLWLIGTLSAQSPRAIEVSMAHFEANRGLYGLSNAAAELRVRRSRSDGGGVTHVRFEQVYKGLPVFEGEAITHVDAAENVTVTNSLRGNINLDSNSRVGRNAAVDTAVRGIAPLGHYEVRDASLWVLPRGDRSIVDRLVWHVAVLVENDFEDPAEWRYFIDARSGSTVWAFDALETGTASKGTGKTMYTGNQTVDTDFTSGTYYLRDLTRGGGNYTCDKNNKTWAPQCGTFSRSNNIFGNNKKDNSDRATAGADAHFGLQATWDYYQNMFGRIGIDGGGRKTYSRVHYGTNYQNAFWSDSCFCMTYGDGGTTFYPLVSLDVAGHEMSHGVLSSEANLTYSGESGGLNESNSDIFGTMVEYTVNNSFDLPDYWIGERIYKANWSSDGKIYTETTALRYMDDPVKDGRSPACWSSGIGSLDVHYSSGPNNHMYWLLAEGGTSKCNGNGVSGIGRDKAARIWYKAISDYMTSSTDYHGARTACLNAAAFLYGSTSPAYAAVNAAYAAINVQ